MQKMSEILFRERADQICQAPGMIEPTERYLLFDAAYNCTQHTVVEFGAFFGASTLALASGLAARNLNTEKIICVDAFEVSKSNGFHKHVIAYAERWRARHLLKEGENTTEWMRVTQATLGAEAERVRLIKGLVDEEFDMSFLPRTIGLLHLDMPKDAETIRPIVKNAFPRLAEGAVIAFQDYAYQFSNELIAFFHLAELEGLIKPYAIAASSMFYRVSISSPKASDWQHLLDQSQQQQSSLVTRATERYSSLNGCRPSEVIALKAATIRAEASSEEITTFEAQGRISKLIKEMHQIDTNRASFVLAELLTEKLGPHLDG